jgi:hypothetical protein
MKIIFTLIVLLIFNCSSSEERAAKVAVSGKNEFVSYKILDIDRKLSWTVSGVRYTPRNPNVDVVYIEFELKNISDVNVEVSFQPTIPLPGGEILRITKVDRGGVFLDEIKHTYRISDDRGDIGEPMNVRNEILPPGAAKYRIFAFPYPIGFLPDEMHFQARIEGQNQFQTIPVKIIK